MPPGSGRKNVFSLTIPKKHLSTGAKIFAIVLPVILATLSIRGSRISAQDFPTALGRIEGDDLEVATKTSTGIETNAGPTVVASGSDVTLRSGHALLLLNSGGEVSICGPAHFKLIKSSGSLTLALDYGRVHPTLESADEFTIYTPTIVATPIAIAGGRRDMTVGLEQNGEMCMLTARGAMRVVPQFSEQSVIVPQGGAVSLTGGQIESLQADASACSCDFTRARMESSQPSPGPHPRPAQDVGVLATPVAPERKKANSAAPPSAPVGEPVYTVLMPPLSFDSNSPEPPPDPSPETILLVREVRLRPLTEFRGHVNPAPAQAALPPTPPMAPAPLENRPAISQPSFLDRLRSFFRRLTSFNHASRSGAGSDS
jgi:hypothetical protein